jgi:glycosyltransferase involved in cell wall biosynthesis
LQELAPRVRDRLRLVLVGDGPLRAEAAALLESAGLAPRAWLAGARDDIPRLLRGLDIFALPSLAEGISNTILEAMASALPVVATRVGGNAELVAQDETGLLVPRADPESLARALATYVENAALIRQHGQTARARIERDFSLTAMVDRYLAVYDELIAERGRRAAVASA